MDGAFRGLEREGGEETEREIEMGKRTAHIHCTHKIINSQNAHIFVGDVCLDQRSVQAGLHVVQLLVVLEEHKSMALFTTDERVLITRYSSSDIQKTIQTLDWFGWMERLQDSHFLQRSMS